MAHAARVEFDGNNMSPRGTGKVREVIVVPDDLGGDENDAAITAYVNGLGLPGTWIRTSYHGNIRGVFAGVGYEYDSETDMFKAPKARTRRNREDGEDDEGIDE
tara:strand:- start:91 stop:402 length:312 start_codon:yes stop_codon:yes gene_type:complete